MITPEQIRSLAIRAGLAGATGTQVPMHKLEAFAALVAAAEREACAQVCEGRNRDGDWFAAEIRARSQA